ncbi:copper fist DNA binding domain-containing protein [Mycena filopes]|nr:copper fist DNA binding domain-containing protein [Mycena filopes]
MPQVLISSKKYACETCIKGHRSSACKHTDRPLFEIKKKGRPVTQCEHCRELRKTKQVHVKCICEAKEPPSPTKKKGEPLLFHTVSDYILIAKTFVLLATQEPP